MKIFLRTYTKFERHKVANLQNIHWTPPSIDREEDLLLSGSWVVPSVVDCASGSQCVRGIGLLVAGGVCL